MAPLAGIGMDMVFVPLFDILLGGVDDPEVGSASGALQAMQQLGMSLGIAGIGTLMIGDGDYVGAAQTTTVVVGVLIAAAFALAFLLPHGGREQEIEAVRAMA